MEAGKGSAAHVHWRSGEQGARSAMTYAAAAAHLPQAAGCWACARRASSQPNALVWLRGAGVRRPASPQPLGMFFSRRVASAAASIGSHSMVTVNVSYGSSARAWYWAAGQGRGQ